jgi:hypothetical protein
VGLGEWAGLAGPGRPGVAEHPIRDVLTFVPLRRLPWWFRWRWAYAAVRDGLEAWWIRLVHVVEDAWRIVR